jgi:hypothetical protein
MTEVSTFRLHVLRATYLLFAVGLGSAIWPGITHPAKPWDLMHGVAMSLPYVFANCVKNPGDRWTRRG